MGSVKSILSLKRIAENEAKRQPVVVVVSALGGVTDKLIEISQVALRGDEHWKDEFQALIDRHHRMIDAVITDIPDTRPQQENTRRDSFLRRAHILEHSGNTDKRCPPNELARLHTHGKEERQAHA